MLHLGSFLEEGGLHDGNYLPAHAGIGWAFWSVRGGAVRATLPWPCCSGYN